MASNISQARHITLEATEPSQVRDSISDDGSSYRDSISDDGQLGIGLTRWRPCNIKACILGFCVIS
jgi:hypothetical protein